jgi:3-methylfumaryl-CoA hydratase
MTGTQLDMPLLQQWTGRTDTSADMVRPEAVAALAATLDCPTVPREGDNLPPLWHWINFWAVAPQAQLGDDGHPLRGGFLPPVPLPRRMWAGGRLQFLAPVPVGAPLTRLSTILDVTSKQGASGALAFVTVRHEISHAGQLAITEEHDIVYRDLPTAASASAPQANATPGKPAPADARWRHTVRPDPVLLFRYSALTFNGHRIHYDRSYVTGVEGYPGLVVHGPLIATLLLEALRREMPAAQVRAFSFRAVSPLFDTEAFTVCGRPAADGSSVSLWAENSRGELAMQAEAVLDAA